MGNALRPAVFLDRDGTINVDKEYLCRIEDFQYMPGVVEGLKVLSGMEFLLVVVTNQSGIARGYYTEEDFQKLNAWIRADLGRRGIVISGIYHCPHHPQGAIPQYAVQCGCRKPLTGLFWRAQRELGIDMDRSFAVGDRLRDLGICRESGVRGIWLGDYEGGLEEENLWGCRDFSGAVRRIVAWSYSHGRGGG